MGFMDGITADLPGGVLPGQTPGFQTAVNRLSGNVNTFWINFLNFDGVPDKIWLIPGDMAEW